MQPVDFALYVPNGFAQILDGVAFAACSPQIFDCVADAEVMALGNADALDAAWVIGVVGWVVDGISLVLLVVLVWTHARHFSLPRLVVYCARKKSSTNRLQSAVG